MGSMMNNVRELRRKAEISQQELAERCECARETIVRIERGIYNPSLELADKIACGLSCSIYDCFPFLDSMPYMSAVIAKSRQQGVDVALVTVRELLENGA